MALRPNEETPSKTPWWLIMLRMLLAALVILALAHPVRTERKSARVGPAVPGDRRRMGVPFRLAAATAK